MMSIPVDELHPPLTLIEGGRDWRADEAHIEVLAAFQEQLRSIQTAYDLLTSLAADYIGGPRTDLRFLRLADMLARMSTRLADAAKEYVALTSPDGVA